jgi:integrase
MTNRHEILGGKVQVYRRPSSPFWQCSASIGGRQYRASTKSDGLSQAKEFAEDWFLELRGKDKWGGGLPKGKTFRKVAEKFLDEFEVITGGQRSRKYVKTLRLKLEKHLNPFFGDKAVSEITAGLIQEYRVQRAKAVDKDGKPKPPARSTIHHEIITIRHVLKTALRHGWLDHLPDMSAPYKASGKIAHRAWFSPAEYQTLYRATRKRAQHPPHSKWKWECEQLHDFVLFMANTGLRPDEAARLEFRDVVIVDDDATAERILEIEVRGKRGVGYCKSMPGAVRPFERLRDRLRAMPEDKSDATRDRREVAEGRRAYGTGVTRTRGAGGLSKGGGAERAAPKSTDLIFGSTQRELLNAVLDELGLKFDRDGQRRTAYSLRHTYICMRLMEGADIYQVAKNCRTSVEMIENFYASHIKNTLDASAINVRKVRSAAKQAQGLLTAEEEDRTA